MPSFCSPKRSIGGPDAISERGFHKRSKNIFGSQSHPSSGPSTLALSDNAHLCLAGTSRLNGSGNQTPCTDHTDSSCSESNERICYGMICDLSIQICPLVAPESLELQRTGTSESDLVYFHLDLSEDCGGLEAKNGKQIAQLNTKTHLALWHTNRGLNLVFSALVTAEKITKRLSEAAAYSKMKPGTVICLVDMLVSGPRDLASEVARRLAKYSLFLQHPYPFSTELAYENPQYLYIPGASLATGTILPPLSAAVMEAADNEKQCGNEPEGAKDNQADPWSILDELSATENLPKAEADERIETQLLNHQKEGVAFIKNRENPESSNLTGLWRLDLGYSMTENIRYRHRITGSIRPSPEDFRGGLLADDMGLGKTLMMITSIVGSMKSANEHRGFQTVSTNANPSPSAPLPIKSTLVLVPSSLLVETWMNQFELHVRKGTLSVYKYHGQQRRLELSSSLPYDVVVSTYATAASDFSRGGGMLSRFKWYRLILDEAHVIRNWSTKQFDAVYNLSTNIRWCMTGTPIQNSIDDLGSLIRFLRVPLLSDNLLFRKHICGIHRADRGHPKLNVANLRLLLQSVSLRRLKSILSLPGVTEVKHEIEFSTRERLAYKTLEQTLRKSIRSARTQPNQKEPSQLILQGILRMRIFCNVGFEGERKSSLMESAEPDQLLSLLQQAGSAKCFDCGAEIMDISEDLRLSHCHSLLCAECSTKFIQISEKARKKNETKRVCPICDDCYEGEAFVPLIGAPETPKDVVPTILDAPRTWPSKLLAVVEDLTKSMQGGKSIVFSFWRQSLDVVGRLLSERGVSYYRVDGLLKPNQRKKILAKFCSENSVTVLLMTLGTGAVGLNDLSIANRVHFLEPQWNPSIENQAIGRVLRLGQEKEVCIIRYIVKDSIEKSIEERQITKIRLAQAGETGLDEGFSQAGLAIISKELDKLGS